MLQLEDEIKTRFHTNLRDFCVYAFPTTQKKWHVFFFGQDTTKHAVSCFQHLNCQHNEKGQLRLYKRRPNPFQLEKGAIEMKEDEVFSALG